MIRLVQQLPRTSAGNRREDVLIDAPDTEQAVADRGVLERVVGNLVTNALHHGAPPVPCPTGARESIARSYARAHGGDLLYHAGEGEGAMFELVLPRTTPPA